MPKSINLKLYKKEKLVNHYKNINAVEQNNKLIFFLEEAKTIVSKEAFVRENEEFRFTLDFIENKCSYLLKKQNLLYDIKVEQKALYKENNKKIQIEYKIETEEEKIRIEIERNEDRYVKFY